LGRSPRVRRNRLVDELDHSGTGSISARAEEPTAETPSSAVSAVDLRACGGTAVSTTASALAKGRSPRVRRNRGASRLRVRRGGSISARAEEPQSRNDRPRQDKVDLRACGGTAGGHPQAHLQEGRSPRVRRNPRCSR